MKFSLKKSGLFIIHLKFSVAEWLELRTRDSELPSLNPRPRMPKHKMYIVQCRSHSYC